MSSPRIRVCTHASPSILRTLREAEEVLHRVGLQALPGERRQVVSKAGGTQESQAVEPRMAQNPGHRGPPLWTVITLCMQNP